MNKLITRISTDRNVHMIFLVLCLILFSGQSYLFITKTFCGILKPFAEHPEIYSFVKEGLWDTWLKMLIWPTLLFIVLIGDLIKMRKSKDSSLTSSSTKSSF